MPAATAPTTGGAAPQPTTAASGASGVAPATTAGSAGQSTTRARSASPPAPAAGAAMTTQLNLNTATREQFLTVPNVGDRMVREFFEYRPYRSIGQFRREIGKYVSQEQVAAYEQFVFVPVDPNNADADTLRQLPGVDANVAAQLSAGRPYASTDAFMAKLGQLVTAEQATTARAYLATQ
ncbi:MAG: hypothetical protein HY329_19160 [Chloroflexi bacterium]|nr:hypothetical protein [Chloroflexota bacterium]